jgi:hypothetical protein
LDLGEEKCPSGLGGLLGSSAIGVWWEGTKLATVTSPEKMKLMASVSGSLIPVSYFAFFAV